MTAVPPFRACLAALCLAIGIPGPSDAGDGPVVVEIFTSQGCSACPPADVMVAMLAERTDVLPLALHVDYWDYIGWRDTFGDPAFTDRQKAYAASDGEMRIYTPQIIVGGTDRVVGARVKEVKAQIARHAAATYPVDLRVARADTRVEIRASLDAAPRPMVVSLVAFQPPQTVEITAGENAGRRIAYHAIVTEIRPIAEWDGTAPLDVAATLEGEGAVIVQERGPGPIVGAARIE